MIKPVDPKYARFALVERQHQLASWVGASGHNLIICTLCSCCSWPVLGLLPYWYKDPTFRARAVRERHAVLMEFGLDIPSTVEIKTWDRWRSRPGTEVRKFGGSSCQNGHREPTG
jgi:Nitrile hydratase, alpha chain